VVSRAGSTLAPEMRRIGMVFQDYALFPHLDVGQNVGFGIHSLPRIQRAARVAEVLELVGLWAAPSSAIRMNSPVASSSAWRWPARWRPSRGCCCWMSRFPTSTWTCVNAWPRKCAPS
jgi:hypothetical protein